MTEAFTAGFLLIALSEFGDKTFFIALILAMRHGRRLAFIGVLASLVLMTILSVVVGQAFSLLPQTYVKHGIVLLFFFFGLKLLSDSSRMPANLAEIEAREATAVVEDAEEGFPQQPPLLAIGLEAFSLTFLAEWGDRTQIATIALAASKDPLGVTAGAILGHALALAIAVLGGRAIVRKIPERVVAALGGSLFILFGAIAFWELY